MGVSGFAASFTSKPLDDCTRSRMSVITAFFSLTVDVRYSWSRSSRKRRSSTISSSIAQAAASAALAPCRRRPGQARQSGAAGRAGATATMEPRGGAASQPPQPVTRSGSGSGSRSARSSGRQSLRLGSGTGFELRVLRGTNHVVGGSPRPQEGRRSPGSAPPRVAPLATAVDPGEHPVGSARPSQVGRRLGWTPAR